MVSSFDYDVFLSYASGDRDEMRELAKRLRADGVRVWFDEWEIQPGDSIPLKFEQGLARSRVLVLCMSTDAFGSEWAQLEGHTFRFRDPLNKERLFIPLRLDDVPARQTLEHFNHIDWREKSEAEYVKLLEVCRPVKVVPSAGPRGAAGQGLVFRGHTNAIWDLAITPDGGRVVSASEDATVRVWNLKTAELYRVFSPKGAHAVCSVAVTPDGEFVISGMVDGPLNVWSLQGGEHAGTLEGHTDNVWSMALTPDGKKIVSGSWDFTARVWDFESRRCLHVLKGHESPVRAVAVTADGQRAISGAWNSTIHMWDLNTGECLRVMKGHTSPIRALAVTPDSRRVISGSADATIRIWDVETGMCVATLEGHTHNVQTVAVTPDGSQLISGSYDKTIRVWDLETNVCTKLFREGVGNITTLVVTPDGRQVISGEEEGYLKSWQLPEERREESAADAILYTNAKVLLVGDSGVGKSGLAHRLTENRFEATVSTDAAWASRIMLPHATGGGKTEREIWLWDFAGQSDYRLIHQLFMDETALAVLVFNPQSENPFEGLGQWDRDLQRAARRNFKKLLVAGRCDRGGLAVSRASVERFMKERGFDAYLETSALTGEGCLSLREEITRNIPWEEIPWISSPRVFKLLKEEIIGLKDEGKVLLRVAELKQQLEARLPTEHFTLEQLWTVVGLLAGPGIVWKLEFGDYVLLQPERVNAYAAAVIRKVRSQAEEIGVISEEGMLGGNLDFEDMERLPRDEEQIVLRAMHQMFIERSLALREHTEAGPLLVFPSYFKRERPDQPDRPAALVTYQFNGMLDEIYATLVVKLRHTAAFDTDAQWLWRFAAEFRTQSGRRVGFYMMKKAEGAAELTVYCEPETPEDTKVTFIRYIHDHLKLKDPYVVRVRHYVCPTCSEPVESTRAVQKAVEAGRKGIPCQYCGNLIALQDLIEEKFASEQIQRRVRELEQQARINLDNESRELILLGHIFAVVGEAGQIFRPTSNSDWGIDGEIEFKDDKGHATGRRVYVQFKAGDSYLQTWKADDTEIFTIKNTRQAEYWQAQAYPVMLIIRTSDGQIRWMNVTDYIRHHEGGPVKQIPFSGEPFTASSLLRLRDGLLGVSE